MSTAPDSDFFEARPVERRRLRSAGAGLFILVGVLVGLLVLAVIADVVVRSLVESRAASEVQTATGLDDVAVDVHGASVLWQIAHGQLDDVTLTSGAQGDPVVARVDVSDVPTSLEGASGAVTGSVTADQATVDGLSGLEEQGAAIALGDDSVTYTRTFDLPFVGGVPVAVDAAPTLSGDGRSVSFAPTAASLPDTSLRLDLTPFLGDFATTLCLAQYLPASVTVTDLQVRSGEATLDFSSPGLPLSTSALGEKGSCS